MRRKEIQIMQVNKTLNYQQFYRIMILTQNSLNIYLYTVQNV